MAPRRPVSMTHASVAKAIDSDGAASSVVNKNSSQNFSGMFLTPPYIPPVDYDVDVENNVTTVANRPSAARRPWNDPLAVDCRSVVKHRGHGRARAKVLDEITMSVEPGTM